MQSLYIERSVFSPAGTVESGASDLLMHSICPKASLESQQGITGNDDDVENRRHLQQDEKSRQRMGANPVRLTQDGVQDLVGSC